MSPRNLNLLIIDDELASGIQMSRTRLAEGQYEGRRIPGFAPRLSVFLHTLIKKCVEPKDDHDLNLDIYVCHDVDYPNTNSGTPVYRSWWLEREARTGSAATKTTVLHKDYPNEPELSEEELFSTSRDKENRWFWVEATRLPSWEDFDLVVLDLNGTGGKNAKRALAKAGHARLAGGPHEDEAEHGFLSIKGLRRVREILGLDPISDDDLRQHVLTLEEAYGGPNSAGGLAWLLRHGLDLDVLPCDQPRQRLRRRVVIMTKYDAGGRSTQDPATSWIDEYAEQLYRPVGPYPPTSKYRADKEGPNNEIHGAREVIRWLRLKRLGVRFKDESAVKTAAFHDFPVLIVGEPNTERLRAAEHIGREWDEWQRVKGQRPPSRDDVVRDIRCDLILGLPDGLYAKRFASLLETNPDSESPEARCFILQEIHRLPLELQFKLAHWLREQERYLLDDAPRDTADEYRSTVRVIATTSHPALAAAVGISLYGLEADPLRAFDLIEPELLLQLRGHVLATYSLRTAAVSQGDSTASPGDKDEDWLRAVNDHVEDLTVKKRTTTVAWHTWDSAAIAELAACVSAVSEGVRPGEAEIARFVRIMDYYMATKVKRGEVRVSAPPGRVTSKDVQLVWSHVWGGAVPPPPPPTRDDKIVWLDEMVRNIDMARTTKPFRLLKAYTTCLKQDTGEKSNGHIKIKDLHNIDDFDLELDRIITNGTFKTWINRLNGKLGFDAAEGSGYESGDPSIIISPPG